MGVCNEPTAPSCRTGRMKGQLRQPSHAARVFPSGDDELQSGYYSRSSPLRQAHGDDYGGRASSLDTRCDQTLVKAVLVPDEEGERANPIKRLCLHGEASVYPRWKIQVSVQGVTGVMPMLIAWHLPYPMILGWDWPEIYGILENQ